MRKIIHTSQNKQNIQTHHKHCTMSLSKFNYGLYPGKNRYHTDQVPFDCSLASTSSYNDKGEGFCWMRAPKVDVTKRMCTIQPTFRAEGPQNVKPAIFFALKPKIVDKKRFIIDVKKPADSRIVREMSQYDSRVDVYFDPKAYASGDVCIALLKDFHQQTKSQGPVILGLDNWGSQATVDYQRTAKKWKVKLVYTPENCTDLCAVTDYGLGATLKKLMVDQYEADFNTRVDYWSGNKNGDKTISLSEKRILFTKWLGNAWETMSLHKQSQITNAFKGCGMYNSVDGSENHLIKLPRYSKEYVVGEMSDGDDDSKDEENHS